MALRTTKIFGERSAIDVVAGGAVNRHISFLSRANHDGIVAILLRSSYSTIDFGQPHFADTVELLLVGKTGEVNRDVKIYSAATRGIALASLTGASATRQSRHQRNGPWRRGACRSASLHRSRR